MQLNKRLFLSALAALIAPLIAPANLAAQQAGTHPQARSVFVEQAPQDAPTASVPQAQPDPTSKVYFPDAITPQTVASSRARNRADTSQLSQTGEGDRDIGQLSDGRSAEVLAQLTPAQREVLIDAVGGTDICEREQSIPALRALCEARLETRSAEFARGSQRGAQGTTAADAILGDNLDSDRLATLEAALSRLARNDSQTNGVDDSVIASVAFTGQGLVTNEAAVESDPAIDLSPETQAVVNAIVQQLGGP